MTSEMPARSPSRAAVWLTGIATVLVVGVGGWLAVSSCVYRSVEAVLPGQPLGPESCAGSLVSVNGPGTLIVLGIPVFLSLIALMGALRLWAWLSWSAAGLLLGFSFLGALSIGVYSLPSAILLVVAAALVQSKRSSLRFSPAGPPMVDG